MISSFEIKSYPIWLVPRECTLTYDFFRFVSGPSEVLFCVPKKTPSGHCEIKGDFVPIPDLAVRSSP
jgi:hypothetical protein